MFRCPLFLVAVLAASAATAAEVENFTIKTLRAQMRYDVTDLTVTPGAQVKIVFENPDDMPHNMVFFQPGTDVVQASNKQMEKPEEALKRNWLPEDPRMWLHSKALNPGEREEIVFKAPDKPGIYPFVCTFPGHAVSMQGRMKIFGTGPTLAGLTFQLYLGDWKKLPDFSSLTPHRIGDVPDNAIALKFDDYKNQYAVVFTGRLTAEVEGHYVFALACDDGARLLIDGKQVIERDGKHSASEIREHEVKLAQGEHEVRLEYFQSTGDAALYLGWRGRDFRMTALSKAVHPQWKAGASAKKKDEKTGMPLVVGKEPVIYRNFIAGAGNRAIAVGYPGAMNLAWSAETMNLALVWRGAFMDAARHWIDRGAGHQAPLGYDVFRPAGGEKAVPFAVLATPEAEWPKAREGRSDGYAWKGYTLDARRVPTFHYTWNGLAISERFEAEGDGLAATGRLVRTLELRGKIPPKALFRIASAEKTQPVGDGIFSVDAGRFGFEGREFEDRFHVAVEGAKTVGRNLVVPAQAALKIIYTWPHLHAH